MTGAEEEQAEYRAAAEGRDVGVEARVLAVADRAAALTTPDGTP